MKISLNDGLFYYDRTRTIFQDLNLNLDEGKILSILGTNGCGKTTLLKCLCGLYPFKGGHLFLDGRESLAHYDRCLFFGYVPQATGVPVPYSVFETVLMGRSRFIGTFSKPTADDIFRVEALLEKVGITRLASRSFSSLSGGEKQMVLICRALATEAEVLVFDEPTSALDLVNQHNTIDLMHKLSHDEGYSIIFSTHDPSHALHLSDYTIMMDKAGNSSFGRAEEIITEARLRSLFGVETRILNVEGVNGSDCRVVMPVLWESKKRSVKI
ncbi:MAG: ABC transporter ATP-binding protein [Sphaerochaeta sp.]|nr:ABC transporter ATP-binding protein [Sphaerochaeta sp.]